MNQLVPVAAPSLPALVPAAGERASMRFLEFFAANIRNPHTRRECRVEQLLDRGIEGVQIRMENSGYCYHPGNSPPVLTRT